MVIKLVYLLSLISIIASSTVVSGDSSQGECPVWFKRNENGTCECGSELGGGIHCDPYKQVVSIMVGYCMSFDNAGGSGKEVHKLSRSRGWTNWLADVSMSRHSDTVQLASWQPHAKAKHCYTVKWGGEERLGAWLCRCSYVYVCSVARTQCLRSLWGYWVRLRWKIWAWSTTIQMYTERPLYCHSLQRRWDAWTVWEGLTNVVDIKVDHLQPLLYSLSPSSCLVNLLLVTMHGMQKHIPLHWVLLHEQMCACMSCVKCGPYLYLQVLHPAN